MTQETIEGLCAMFSEDIVATRHQFDFDELKHEIKFNIAENLRLATGSKKARSRATRSIPNMENTTAPKKEGKFDFIKSLILAGTYTRAQIVDATRAKFPRWDAKLLECGVYSSRTQLRKLSPGVNWRMEDTAAVAATTEAQPAAAV